MDKPQGPREGARIRAERVHDTRTKEQRHADNISRFIETRILGRNEGAGEDVEEDIRLHYRTSDAREKADALYARVMAYWLDLKAERQQQSEAAAEGRQYQVQVPDSELISEIKVLFEDAGVRRVLPETYGKAQTEKGEFRVSDLGRLWKQYREDMVVLEEEYRQLEQDIHLDRVEGRGRIEAVKGKIGRLARRINSIEDRLKGLVKLEGQTQTKENTDAAAIFMFEQLRTYQDQLNGEDKFVWLPSRREIHNQVVAAILNHRIPSLLGEAGTGKSHQANAAAVELTGSLPERLACSGKTGSKQMIEDVAIDPETGGSYKEFGPVMRAYTGYDDSRQDEPAHATGRLVRFDEANRLGNDAYAIIKELRQQGTGDDLNGRPVLAGAGMIWSSNPVGPRYPDRRDPDPAMRREIADITVTYPEMSSENPEIYEFMLTALMTDNRHIEAAEQELKPAYVRVDMPEANRQVLPDGRVVVAKDELVPDAADASHGALWRFAAAIHALHESFVHGNAESESYPESLLRFQEQQDGAMDVVRDGGEPLTLATSTVTLGELASWMTGFNERKEKKDKHFRTKTLTEWLNFKIAGYVKQADKEDKPKLEALFRHFGFLDAARVPDISDAVPMTPQRIGYLSPRVPRPVHAERVTGVEAPEEGADLGELKEYETVQVLLESGERVLVRVKEMTIGEGDDARTVQPGKRVKHSGPFFTFSGVIDQPGSAHDGMPVAKHRKEDLNIVLDEEELELGVFESEAEALWERAGDPFTTFLREYWGKNCEGNADNNPEGTPEPSWTADAK